MRASATPAPPESSPLCPENPLAQDARLIERYEAKYRIPVRLVEPIRDAALAACDPDPANKGGRYVISSLYLDTRLRRLYRETIDRAPRRFKLRVRRYATGERVFLEVKRRIKGVISKLRVPIPLSAWPGVVFEPAVAAALDLSARDRKNLDDFVWRCISLAAEPATVVRYEREAYISRLESYARVTFDWRLCGRAPSGWNVSVHPDDGPWLPVDAPRRFGLPESGVILELKAETAVPLWMTDIVHRFGLTRSGFSKYACCLEAVEPFRAAAAPPMRAPSRALRPRLFGRA